MTYEQIEDDLVFRLRGFFFGVEALPDNESAFRPVFSNPQVFVMYENSDYAEPENLSKVVQKDKIRVGFEIHARTRRGETGIFAIQKIIFARMLGYKLKGCDKFQLVSFGPLQGNSPNNWIYYAQFQTMANIVESIPDTDEDSNLPTLKKVDVIV